MGKRDPQARSKYMRKRFEAGDPLTLNEAYLVDGGPRWAWVRGALAKKLYDELKRKRGGKQLPAEPRTTRDEKREKALSKELARFETVCWFMRHGYSRDQSCKLAVRAYGEREAGGDSTFKHAYDSFRKKHGLPPRGRTVPLQGGEEVTPADLAEGPEDLPGDPARSRLYRLLETVRSKK